MDLDYKKIKEFWDCRAKSADSGMRTVNLGTTSEQSQIQLRCLKESLDPQDKRVLDLGCGLGRVTQAMAKKDRVVVGVDFSYDMLLALKKKLPPGMKNKIDIVCANVSQGVPFGPAVFDVVVIFGVLLHINDADVFRIISEAKRVTKKNGKIIIRESVGVGGRFEVNKYSEELGAEYTAIYRSPEEIEKDCNRCQLTTVVRKVLYQQRKETATWYWVFQT